VVAEPTSARSLRPAVSMKTPANGSLLAGTEQTAKTT
jgi:hypothetical protein